MNVQQWILEVLDKELARKVDAPSLKNVIHQNPQMIPSFIKEIQQALDLYNQDRKTSDVQGFPKDLYKNAFHLSSIWKQPLPEYENLIGILRSDKKLSDAVFSELRDSTYFKEVFTISKKDHLLHNLLILFYRTSMLALNPVLREKKAQISSTIEEMGCALALEGKKTHLFDSTRHWIQNWQEEDFSPHLIKLLREKSLI